MAVIKKLKTKVKNDKKNRYELACSKKITILAVVLEVMMLISVILLAESLAFHYLNLPTPLAQHIPVVAGIILVVGLQYCILFFECIARYRDDQRGLTIPLAFVPGGIILRTCIMVLITVPVIIVKFLVYFMAVLLAFIFQCFRINKSGFLVSIMDFVTDLTDSMLEPIEALVNKVYNLLYYHKINANSSIFTSIFNGSLSFWCINH